MDFDHDLVTVDEFDALLVDTMAVLPCSLTVLFADFDLTARSIELKVEHKEQRLKPGPPSTGLEITEYAKAKQKRFEEWLHQTPGKFPGMHSP